MVSIDGDWAEFTFFRPQAQQVFIAGDFNDWREGEFTMSPMGDGYWTARMRMPAGVFKFRYCADGAWYTDFAAFGVEPGRFGLDSVIRVEPRTLTLPTPATVETETVAA